MKRMRLTKEELEIENAPLSAFRPLPQAEFEKIARAFARQRKDAILHIRINREDLDGLKKKAKSLKVPYRTLIAEILHRHSV